MARFVLQEHKSDEDAEDNLLLSKQTTNLTKNHRSYGSIPEQEDNDTLEPTLSINARPTRKALQFHDPLLDAVHQEQREPLASRAPSSPNTKLGTLSLTILIFYGVSGGPIGIESTVRAGGNFFALLGFLLMPLLVWSLPLACITAELGTAFPEPAGSVAWVEVAFGPFCGWMAGYLRWVASVTDTSVYPVLFMDYLLQIVRTEDDNLQDNSLLRFALLSTATAILSYISWLGLPLVGKLSMTLCIVAMSPFVVFCVVGAFKVQPRQWLRLPDAEQSEEGVGGGMLLRPFLNNLFWNMNYLDGAASFAADVASPEHGQHLALPRALFWSVLLIWLGCLLPLLIATGAAAADAQQSDWVDGYLARAASEIVSPWLGAWIVFAAAIGNISLFQTELCTGAYQLLGMAQRGYLPQVFCSRSRHGTPTTGILLATVIVVLLGIHNLDELIEMLNFNYAITLLMEYGAFIKLRISQPNLARPYRVPLNTLCCGLGIFPAVMGTIIVVSLATYKTYAFSAVINVVGMVLFACRRAVKTNE